MLIRLAGLPASGKDTVAEYLCRKFGFRLLSTSGDIFLPRLAEEGKPITRQNMIDVAMRMTEKYGVDILARIISEKVEPEMNFAIMRVRFTEEVEYFKIKFGKSFKLLAVKCSPGLRYKRAWGRGEKARGSSHLKNF